MTVDNCSLLILNDNKNCWQNYWYLPGFSMESMPESWLLLSEESFVLNPEVSICFWSSELLLPKVARWCEILDGVLEAAVVLFLLTPAMKKNRCIQFLMYLMVWMLEFFCNSSKRIAFKIFIHALDWLLEFKILSVLAYKTFQNKDCNLAKNGWALKLEMDKNAMANGKFLAVKLQWLKIN